MLSWVGCGAADDQEGDQRAEEGEGGEDEDSAEGAGLEVGTEDVAEDGVAGRWPWCRCRWVSGSCLSG